MEAKDGMNERNPVHIVRDLAVAVINGSTLRPKNNNDLRPTLGNYIILKSDAGFYALIAHTKKDSIKISKGENITELQNIAEEGHSGSSTAPHLHFQLKQT